MPGYEGGYFVGPTIFDHVTEEMSCGREEVFGPVTFIKRIDDFEEGLEIANAQPLRQRVVHLHRERLLRPGVRAADPRGMVGVNVGIPVPVAFFPFAGHKESFFGDKHVLGMDGVDFYTESKGVTTRWFSEEDKQATRVSTWEGTTTRDFRGAKVSLTLLT